MPPSNVVIDLSHHNGNIDMAAVAAGGVQGVIHKATQGWSYVRSMLSVESGRRLGVGNAMGCLSLRGGSRWSGAGRFLLVDDSARREYPAGTGLRGQYRRVQYGSNRGRGFRHPCATSDRALARPLCRAVSKRAAWFFPRSGAFQLLVVAGAVWSYGSASAWLGYLDLVAIHGWGSWPGAS